MAGEMKQLMLDVVQRPSDRSGASVRLVPVIMIGRGQAGALRVVVEFVRERLRI